MVKVFTNMKMVISSKVTISGTKKEEKENTTFTKEEHWSQSSIQHLPRFQRSTLQTEQSTQDNRKTDLEKVPAKQPTSITPSMMDSG